MDIYLDQLFLSRPYEHTLAHLIYQGASNNSDRIWHKSSSATITFSQAENLTNDIAAFLRYKGFHHRYRLFISSDDGIAAYLVLLAALKAGITVTDAAAYLPDNGQFSDPMKGHLIFKDRQFIAPEVSIKFEDGIKAGEQMLFFNIPATCRYAEAFYIHEKTSSGATVRVINQMDAVHSICHAADGRLMHPYLRMIYCWFKGLPANEASGTITTHV